jgi:hypothetical protein
VVYGFKATPAARSSQVRKAAPRKTTAAKVAPRKASTKAAPTAKPTARKLKAV